MSQAGIINVAGGGGGGSPIMTITGNDGVPTSPTGNNVNMIGLTVANATNAIPVYVKHTATSTDSIEVQVSEAAGSSNINNAGLASFNSSQFTVDANGYVSAIDTGTITSVTTSNATAKFVLTGTTENINFGIDNLILGSAGVNITSAAGNVGFGDAALLSLTTGTHNTIGGRGAGSALTTGTSNAVWGYGALATVTTQGGSVAIGSDALASSIGSNNIGIGTNSGSSYLSTESSNIVLSNTGTSSDNNTIRIGTQGSGAGQQNKAFIAGIVGVTASNQQFVTINSSTGQLGVTNQSLLWSDTSGTVTAVANNGYFITAASTSTLPASPSEGDIVSYVVDTASTLTITASTGKFIRVGAALSASAGTCVNTARGDSITLVYRATGTTWFSLTGPQGIWNIT